MPPRLHWKSLINVFLSLVLVTMFMKMRSGTEDTLKSGESDLELRKFRMKEEIKRKKLEEYQKVMFSKDYHRRPYGDDVYNINVTLAEQQPLFRKIPDTRPPACLSRNYDMSELPSLTVIIPFYNEALSMLLRTVHSVLERTPPELLKDFLLINDHSTNEDLTIELPEYVKLLPDKVKLITTSKREGLIRARMLGADLAQGDVIMFQDAHTEANINWAEPMLYEMKKNPKTIMQPEVDQIEQWTLAYTGSSGVVSRGGWSWDLRYVWMEVPDHEKSRLEEQSKSDCCDPEALPFRAAALVGCALMVNRDYFLSIGGFDESMNIWGGENIELAIRNWLCGGQVLTHPCSRVAHTFKPFSYHFDGDREKIVQKNLMRIAELWMDDWKKYFYASTWSWPSKHTPWTPDELESLGERRSLARKLECKPFRWYMENIYPDVPTPPLDSTWYGEVTNLRTDACLFVHPDGYVGVTYFCFFHRVLPKNLFHIDDKSRLMYRNQCVIIDYDTWLLKLDTCKGSYIQKESWEMTYNTDVHPLEGILKATFLHPREKQRKSTLCLTQVTNVTPKHNKEQMPQLMECNSDNEFQRWRWQYHFDFKYDFNRGQ